MNRKTEFLGRLFALASCIDDLVAFLIAEKLLSEFQYSCLKQEADKPKFIYTLLEELKKADRLLLLDYEWSLLPIERLKLTIITERTTREFTYN